MMDQTRDTAAMQASHRTSSFFWPMQAMAPHRRQAMHSLYRFCRVLDDCADGAASQAEKHALLDEWEAEIERVFSGNPHTPLGQALLLAQQHYAQDKRYFLEMIEGMRMDVRAPMIAPDLAQLARYCYCVAGCVGLLALPIFGRNSLVEQRFACALGYAMQLTNILRDIRKDAQMGRIYLPSEWLYQAQLAALTPDDVPLRLEALQPVLYRLSDLAQAQYDLAEQQVSAANRRALMPALLMRDVYYRLHQRMARDGFSHGREYRVQRSDTLRLLYRVMVYQLAPAA